ncbi:MAG: cold-shock protein [Alphaproteobacteria bacterium]|nr:cold-shock protein [Alphaproteobacteria bacterium]
MGGGAPRRNVDLSSAVETIGTVKWYNPDKGFGFVTPDGGGKDVFVHATALERAGLSTLAEGQSVRMAVVQGQKGPEAGSISAA